MPPLEAFPPAGVSRIPVAGLGFHSQRVALLSQFISFNHNICFYRSLIRSVTSLIGTEGGDSCGNSKRSSVERVSTVPFPFFEKTTLLKDPSCTIKNKKTTNRLM